MKYTVVINKSAKKELYQISSRFTSAIVQAIWSLANEPRPPGCKKLKGKLYNNMWRIRVGDYRILYLIEDVVKVIDVKRIGHRKDIYQ